MTAALEAPRDTAAGPAGGPPPPAARWLRRLWPVPAALAVLAALALVPDWGRSEPGPGEAFVAVDGSARVERADGTVEVLVGGGGGTRPAEATLRQGDAIDVVAGRADLQLSGSIRMEAPAGSGLVMGRTPELRGGDLLVTGNEATTVAAGGTRVRFEASNERPVAGRLARTAGLSIGLYEGAARVDSAGETAGVRALRRVDVAAPGEVTGAQPLRYDEADPWDRRFLGAAISLDDQLASLLPGIIASAGRDLGRPANLAAVLDALDGMPSSRELERLVDPDRPPGDLLAGATISGLADGGSYADRWRATFRFRDAGATWGLVTLDRGVGPEAVLRALAEIVDAAPQVFDDEAATPDGPGGGGGAGGGAGDPSDGPDGPGGGAADGSGGGGGGGGGDGPGTPTLPPVPTLPPTTLPGVPPTTDPIGGIVDGLGDTVDDVLDGLGDTVEGVADPPQDPGDEPDCLLGLICG